MVSTIRYDEIVAQLLKRSTENEAASLKLLTEVSNPLHRYSWRIYIIFVFRGAKRENVDLQTNSIKGELVAICRTKRIFVAMFCVSIIAEGCGGLKGSKRCQATGRS